jgi:uncharacterized protein involved in copper resistance
MGETGMAGMAQPGAADVTDVSSPDAAAANMGATDMTAAEMPATDVTAAEMHPADMTAAKVAPTVAAATEVTTATVAAATMATTAARQGAGRETQHAKGDAHQKHACCLGHREFSCDAASGRAHAPVRLKNLGVWSNRF